MPVERLVPRPPYLPYDVAPFRFIRKAHGFLYDPIVPRGPCGPDVQPDVRVNEVAAKLGPEELLNFRGGAVAKRGDRSAR